MLLMMTMLQSFIVLGWSMWNTVRLDKDIMDQHSTHTHVHLREASKQTTRRLSISPFLTLAFVVIEAGAGISANSLALLTDAAHNLTDVIV